MLRSKQDIGLEDDESEYLEEGEASADEEPMHPLMEGDEISEGLIASQGGTLKKIRNQVSIIVESIYVQLLLAVLLIVDVVVMITEFVREVGYDHSTEEELDIFTMCVLGVFALELIARMFVYGKRFWMKVLHYFEVLGVLAGLLLLKIVQPAALLASIRVLHFLSYIFRTTVLLIRTRRTGGSISVALRRIVSESRRRYQTEEWDIDLTYIRQNLIATSWPSRGREGIYRNRMKYVRMFLDEHHSDNYRVYNLCAERDYPPASFHNRTEHYKVWDHNAPPLATIRTFCQSVHQWLSEDPKHVVVVHCKGGKGRTGTMVASWLLYSRTLDTATEALTFYGKQRTTEGGRSFQGVESPSQERYVRYWEQLVQRQGNMEDNLVIESPRLYVTAAVMSSIPGNFADLAALLQFGEIRVFHTEGTMQLQEIHVSSLNSDNTHESEDGILLLLPDLPTSGDVRVVLYEKTPKYAKVTANGTESVIADKAKKYLKQVWRVWFHTSFVEGLEVRFAKSEIDIAFKDHTGKYADDFTVRVHVSRP